jgi:hypothetical protein
LLHTGEGTSERGLKSVSLTLDHDARKAAQDHLDAAQKVDATTRAVDVAHPNGDALDGARVLPELFAEPSSDVCPVVLIKPDTGNSNVRRCQPWSRPTGSPLHWPGHSIREWFSLSSVSRASAFA